MGGQRVNPVLIPCFSLEFGRQKVCLGEACLQMHVNKYMEAMVAHDRATACVSCQKIQNHGAKKGMVKKKKTLKYFSEFHLPAS